ncbi:MAG: YfiR family protein [Verrucomicrobiota bacterium]
MKQSNRLDLRQLQITILYWRILMVVLLWMGFGATARAQETAPEYKIKAVYLYNFVQYVNWPSNAFVEARSPIVIGILGNDPFGKTLNETVEGEVVKNRKLEIRYFKSVNEIKDCHVLFVGASEKDRVRSILAAMKERSILTVSDIDNFTLQGGIIRFFTADNKIRLRINLEAAKTANLGISSKLLQVAVVVSTDPSLQ